MKRYLLYGAIAGTLVGFCLNLLHPIVFGIFNTAAAWWLGYEHGKSRYERY